MQCLCFNFGVNYSRVSLCNPVYQQDEDVNSGRLFRWYQATPHLHCPPPAPILILVSSGTSFLAQHLDSKCGWDSDMYRGVW